MSPDSTVMILSRFDDTLKVISLSRMKELRQLKHFSAVDSSSLIRIILSREFLVLP